MKREAVEDFIRSRLTLASPPRLPELRIYAAHSGSGLRQLAGDAAPYWAYPWPGGLALARFVLDDPGTVAGRHVLDLGCGSGLAGLAAARAGAAAVSAFDRDPFARVAAGLNAQANGALFAVLDALECPPPGVGLVLAGDVFYAAATARRMTACLRRFREAGAAVLVGDPGREHLPRSRLRELARIPVTEFGGTPATGFVFAFEP